MSDEFASPNPEAEKPQDGSQGRYEVKIVRDSTFTRAVADEAIVLHLGKDIELAFLQIGQNPLMKYSETDEDGDEGEGFGLEPVLTEVSRVRMSSMQSLFMALSIFDTLIEAGKVKRVPFERSIQRLMSKFGVEDGTASDAE